MFDLACGTGDFCRELSRAGHRPIGFDFAFGMLENARTAAPLVQADVLRLPASEASADAITCGFALRNVVSLGELFAELGRVVRPGGTHRPARDEPSGEPGVARRPRPVLRQGGAVDRRPAVGPRGLCVPAEIDGLPAAGRGDARLAREQPASPTRGASSCPVASSSCCSGRARERRRSARPRVRPAGRLAARRHLRRTRSLGRRHGPGDLGGGRRRVETLCAVGNRAWSRVGRCRSRGPANC